MHPAQITIDSYKNGEYGEIVENIDIPNRFFQGDVGVKFIVNPAYSKEVQLAFSESTPYEDYLIANALEDGRKKDFK